MNQKHLFILTGVLIVLALLVTAKSLHKPQELKEEVYESLNFEIDPQDVAQIDISKSEAEGKRAPVQLIRKRDKWEVASFSSARADKEKIRELLGMIETAKGEERARDLSLLHDFGIEDDSAIRVALTDDAGEILLEFLVGTKKPNYFSSFIRKAGSDAVYSVEANFGQVMGVWDFENNDLKSEYWVSKKPLQLKSSQVASFRILEGDIVKADIKSVSGGDQKWDFSRADVSSKISDDKVTEYLDRLTNWNAAEIADPKNTPIDFDRAFWNMSLHLMDGSQITLQAVEDDENKTFWVKIQEEPVRFGFGSYSFEQVNVADSHFYASKSEPAPETLIDAQETA